MDKNATLFSEEQMEKARECGSVEELLALAKENGVELTKEQAEMYLNMLYPANGELVDEELDNVSGGCSVTVGKTSYTVVTSGCSCFKGKYKQGYSKISTGIIYLRSDYKTLRSIWSDACNHALNRCGSCYYLEFISSGTGYCGLSGS